MGGLEEPITALPWIVLQPAREFDLHFARDVGTSLRRRANSSSGRKPN
jgi:hypothetical protein